MKYINKIGMTMMACTALAIAACSDFSDYNASPAGDLGTGSKTLWENIQENGELTRFAIIIEKAGYVDNLNSSRYVTVWAPKDGTYNADSVLSLADNDALEYFVKHHVADYAHRTVDAASEPKVYTLDKKNHIFTDSSFGRVGILQKNIAASNGVLHVINSNDPFYYNISEEFSRLQGCDTFKKYISMFNDTTLDKNSSVIGPIIDGKQTYLDSVKIISNSYFTSRWRAKLDSEDSTYTLLAPTDAAWDEAFNRIRPLYKYPVSGSWFCLDSLAKKNTTAKATTTTISSSLATAQSLVIANDKTTFDATYYTDSLTRNNMLNNLVFSMTNTRNSPLLPGVTVSATDTLISTRNTKLSNVSDILNSTEGDIIPMSNGYMRKVNTIAQYPWETYNPVRTYYSASRGVNCTPTDESIVISEMTPEQMDVFSDMPGFIKKALFPDGETKLRYCSSVPKTAQASPELDIALRSVMATKYRVLVVTLPSQIEKNSTAAALPQQLKFIFMNLQAKAVTDGEVGTYTVGSVKMGGNTAATRGVGAKLWERGVPFSDKTTNGMLTTNAGKANLIDLGEYTIPICCDNIDIYPSLMIVNSVSAFTSANKNKYEQYIRIAKVLLIPTDRYDSFINEE